MAMTTGMATSRPSASIDSLLKLEFESYNELLGHEGDDSSQLRVMELNLELEEEVSIYVCPPSSPFISLRCPALAMVEFPAHADTGPNNWAFLGLC